MKVKVISVSFVHVVLDTDKLLPGDRMESEHGWFIISSPPETVDGGYQYYIPNGVASIRPESIWTKAGSYVTNVTPCCNVNFHHIEEGSQHYTDLAQLLQTMKYLKMNKDLLASRTTGRYRSDIPLYDEIDYIIKGLENSIAAGYYVTKDNVQIKANPPEGYMVILVPVGSYIVSPDQVERLLNGKK